MKILRVGEARAELPAWIRKVRSGHPPVAIGRRGKAEVWLTANPPAPAASVQPLVGTLEIVEGMDLESGDDAIRKIFAESLARSAAELAGQPVSAENDKRSRPRRRRR